MNLMSLVVQVTCNDQASSAISSLSSSAIAKVSAIGTVVSSVFKSAMSAVTSSIDDAISRVDTLNAYPTVMENLGFSASEAEASVEELAEAIEGLPTTLDGIVSITQRIATLCDSLDEATSLSIAINDLLVAGGQSTTYVNSALTQFTQMLSTGTFDVTGWNSVINAAAGQMLQLAEYLLGAGATTDELREALNEGTVSVDDFIAAIIELDQNGTESITSFAQQAQDATGGIATSIENVKTAIVRNLAEIIDAFNEDGEIATFLDSIKAAIDAVGDAITEAAGSWDLSQLTTFAGGVAALATAATIAEGPLNNLVKPLATVSEYAETAFTAISSLADNGITLLNKVLGGSGNLISSTSSGTGTGSSTGILATVVETLYNSIAKLAGAATPVISAAFSAFGTVLTAVGSVAASVASALLTVSGVLTIVSTGLAAVALAAAYAGADFEEFGNTFSSAIITISTQIAEFIGDITNAIPAAVEGVSEIAPQIIDAIVTGLRYVGESAERFLPAFETLVLTIVPYIAQLLATSGPQLLSGALTLFTTLVDAMAQAVPLIAAYVPTFIQGLVDAYTANQPAMLQAGIDLFTAIATAVPEVLPTILEAIPQIIETITAALPEAVPQIIEAAGTFLLGIIESIPEVLPDILDAICDLILTIIENIPTWVPMLLEAAVELFWAIVDAIPEIVSDVLSALGDLLQDIWDCISDFDLFEAGKNLISSVISGVKSMAGELVSAVTSLFSSAESEAQSSASKTKSTATKSVGGGNYASVMSAAMEEPEIRYHAKGGAIVREPTPLDVVGEAGAEAIVPLTNRRYSQPFADVIAAGVAENLAGTFGLGTVVNITIDGTGTTARVQQIALELLDQLEKEARL